MSDHEMWAAMNEEAYPEETEEKLVERIDSDATLEDKRTAFERLMDRAAKSGPNKDKAKEFLAEDDTEPTETEEPTSLVGTMTSGTTAAVRPSYHSGGIVSSTHGSTWVSPGTTPTYYPTTPPGMVTPGGGMSWGVPATPTPAAAPKKAASVEQVPMPSKFTPKVLVAFLEEQGGEMDDKLVWAAHLLAEHFEMRLEDGEIRLVMEFSLRDHYGNNPSTED